MNFEPTELLRSQGLQVTAQRIAVLRAVGRLSHSTADDIAKVVRAELGSISRQAVYDVLGVLMEKGLLRRLQPVGSAALYEMQVNDDHHHVVCRRCGKTEDIPAHVSHSDLATVISQTGFQIERAEVIFEGLCPVCLQREVDSNRAKRNITVAKPSATIDRTTQSKQTRFGKK